MFTLPSLEYIPGSFREKTYNIKFSEFYLNQFSCLFMLINLTETNKLPPGSDWF